MQSEQLGYDTGASGETQSNLNAVGGRLLSLINQHNADVARAMANYEAEGVSAAFQGKADRWFSAANHVTSIVHLVQRTMSENDDLGAHGQARAQQAVDSI